MRIGGKIILNFLKDTACKAGGLRPASHSCNEPSGCINTRKPLDQLSNYRILKNDSAPWNLPKVLKSRPFSCDHSLTTAVNAVPVQHDVKMKYT